MAMAQIKPSKVLSDWTELPEKLASEVADEWERLAKPQASKKPEKK